MSCRELSNPVGHEAFARNFKGTVLIADDEAIVRMVLEEMLVRIGFDVFTAEDGSQALELFSKEPDKFDLVIFDMTMPQMSGEELFYNLQKIKPDVRAVLSSGYQEEAALDEMQAAGLSGILPKPYNMGEITDELTRILDQD